MPSDTALLLLSPPYVLVDSPKPFHRLWSILPSHLISLVPPASPEPSTSPVASSLVSTVSSLGLTTPQSNSALVTISNHTRSFLSLSSMDSILRANRSATINFLTVTSNVKQWANVLTFRQSSSPSSPAGPSSSATPPPPDRLDDKALGDLRPPSSRARSTTPCETEPGTAQFANSPSTPPINRTSLTEATASINRGLLGLPEPDLQRHLQQQPQADATASRVRNAGQDEVQSRPSPMLTPAMSHVGAPGAIIDGLPGAECSPSPTRAPRYVHSNRVQVIPFGDRNYVSWKLCRRAMKRKSPTHQEVPQRKLQ